MERITSIEALGALYDEPKGASLLKVVPTLTPKYRAWIEGARFCVLTTVGPEGTDCSPRGDDGPVVRILDDTRLALPDWQGNQRLDSLRNIVRDGRASLMFMVAGSNNVVRLNGTAFLTADAELLETFEKKGRRPRTAIIFEIAEAYFQCARALMRAGLWSQGDQSTDLPTVGAILQEITEGNVGGASYDKDWHARAIETLW